MKSTAKLEPPSDFTYFSVVRAWDLYLSLYGHKNPPTLLIVGKGDADRAVQWMSEARVELEVSVDETIDNDGFRLVGHDGVIESDGA